METIPEVFNTVSYYNINHHFGQEKPHSVSPCSPNLADVSTSLPAKRKRGRPRKDGHPYREVTALINSPKNSQEIGKNAKSITVVDDTLVGTTVHGVIEGSFDAGYLISVRIGNKETAFRGVVFQPRKFVPITAANDIAPQAKMYQRREINPNPLPAYDDSPSQNISSFSPQPENPIFRPALPPPTPMSATPSYQLSNTHSTFVQKQSPFVHSTGNLRMVEEDEVMQAFEVSSSSKNNTAEITSDMIPESLFKAGNEIVDRKMKGPNLELHHNFMQDMPRCAFEIQRDEMVCPENFHQNLLSNHQSQPDKLFLTSDHLKLDLSNAAFHEKKSLQLRDSEACVETNYLGLNNGIKSSNLGYQQALVAGNPLLLPPGFIGEPLEFMLGKPNKSPTNSRTNLEVEPNAAAGAPYNLELATSQSNLNAHQTNSSAACINDMDFDLSDVVQPTEPHGRQSFLSETDHR